MIGHKTANKDLPLFSGQRNCIMFFWRWFKSSQDVIGFWVELLKFFLLGSSRGSSLILHEKGKGYQLWILKSMALNHQTQQVFVHFQRVQPETTN